MPSQSAFDRGGQPSGSADAGSRRLVAWIVAATVAIPAGAAQASEKQECSAAYEETQTLRLAGKIQAARQRAAACTRDGCAEFIRTDCVKWLGELESSQPTVVFDVRDAGGKETSALRIDLDGKPWLEALDGTAKPIDPGPHLFRYTLPGGESLDATVQIREGEKKRKLRASFQKAALAPIVDATPPPLPGGEAPQRSVAPWVIGGVGLAGLVVGSVLGGLVLRDRATTETECNPTSLHCTPAGLTAANEGRTLGPVSTVGFIVGGVGAGVCAAWLLVRVPATSQTPATTVGMGPAMTAGGGGWHWQGSW